MKPAAVLALLTFVSMTALAQQTTRPDDKPLRGEPAQEASPDLAPAQENPLAAYSTTPEFRGWWSSNPWFGSDSAKTEFAVHYAKQLKQERPDLTGRPFLDALSARVRETFDAAK